MVHIPYKATPVALADIMSGTIDFMWDFSIVLKPLIDGGKLRALAVSGTSGCRACPTCRPRSNSAIRKSYSIRGRTVVMPKDVPKPVADKFIAAFAEVMKEPATIKYYEDTGSQDSAADARREAYRVSGQRKGEDKGDHREGKDSD